LAKDNTSVMFDVRKRYESWARTCQDVFC